MHSKVDNEKHYCEVIESIWQCWNVNCLQNDWHRGMVGGDIVMDVEWEDKMCSQKMNHQVQFLKALEKSYLSQKERERETIEVG